MKRSFMMPDGSTYSYTYNDNNELEEIRIPGVGDISYPSYTLGRPDSMSSPGGSQTYGYDALARLEALDSTTLDYAYTYDDVGNILTKTTGDGNYVYDYDDVYRVTDVDNPTLDDEAYTYDGVGNRETASGVTGSITHNANNELTVYGEISYEYDANGNMVSKTSASESWAYTYNVQNRLVQVEKDDLLIAEYGYDPFGRRLWKEVDGVRTYFLYSDEGLVAEYDENGNEIRSYGYQPDSMWTIDPLWLKQDGEYYWYQNDHLGTPQKLVDSAGTVVWDAQYTAFGEAQISIETVTNNLRFPGQYYDAETELHYNLNRYYDTKVGRYLRTDPIGFKGGDVNWYAYVWNHPINTIDSFGLASCEYLMHGRICENQPDKKDFFNFIFHPTIDPNYNIQNIRQMAKHLGVNEDLLITLAVKEGGWSNNHPKPDHRLQHNIDLNNPFGLTDAGGDNIEFDSVAHAIDVWMRQPSEADAITYADRIRDAVKRKGSPDLSVKEFVDALLCEGGVHCNYPYNSLDPKDWRDKFKENYDSVRGWDSEKCGVFIQGWKALCSKTCNLNESQ